VPFVLVLGLGPLGAAAQDSRVVPSSPGQITLSYAPIVKRVAPAVVNVYAAKVVENRNPLLDDPIFRRFFGNPGGSGEQIQRSLGSGVVVDPAGLIVTNNHVIEGADQVKVSLADRREFEAEIVLKDARSDLAVLRIGDKREKFAAIDLGDSDALQVGDVVLALGNPFGVGQTVTHGIVSAVARTQIGITDYQFFIQTDAAINPGNSGGALVNDRGELIGINTAIISNGGGGNQGIGFAIPITMARSVMEQILKTGKVTRGYLGVMIQEVTPDLAKAFGLPSAEGALVGDVTPDSPGAKAGLQKGDVITSLNGQRISDYTDLRLRVSQSAPGTAAKLEVLRNGQKRDLTVTLAEYPEKTEAAAESKTGESPAMEGVQVEALTSEITQQLNLPAGTRGVVITRVDPDSTAAEAGLDRGDVIQEVNRKPVASVDQFRTAIRSAENQPLLMLVNRGGNSRYVVIAPK
jgi:Do/DeqQ family serine protease